MRLRLGITPEDARAKAAMRLAVLTAWHPFWPWWPRLVKTQDKRCFEWIERKGVKFSGESWQWQYRLPDQAAKGISLEDWMEKEITPILIYPEKMTAGAPFILPEHARIIVRRAVNKFGKTDAQGK